LLVLFGCAKKSPVVADRISVGDRAPRFALFDIFGREQVTSAKVVYNNNATVIVIWSMACPSCREALMDVQKVYERYSPNAIAFLGVNFDVENIRGVKSFLRAEGIDFTTVWDKARRVTRDYKALDYTFSVFVVDRNGRIILAQYDHPPNLGTVLAETLDGVLAGLGK
jgi:peroxiredoxin